jgi:hypothetical protein
MSLPVDLISLDLTKRLPFRLKPPLLQAAVARGVHFEARVILLQPQEFWAWSTVQYASCTARPVNGRQRFMIECR